MNASTLNASAGDDKAMEPACALALQASFGSVQRWREEFVSMAKALSGGPGCVLLCFQPPEGSLANHVCADPSHAPAGAVPLLELNATEAAGHAAWAETFVDNITWPVVYARYQAAVYAASEPLAARSLEGATVLDVRRAGVFANATTTIPGAAWKDPADVANWAAELPRDANVVVYCVYGHEVGRATALRLRAAGVKARYLEGGIDGWQSSGQPLAPKA